LWLNKRLNSVQLESFLSQKSHCFELHFDLFREKSAGMGAGMGAGMSAGMSAGRGVEGRLIRGILVKMVL
jgi:hypothetical protein